MGSSKMADAFTIIGKEHQETVFEDFEENHSAKIAAPAITFLASVRAHHPDMTVTITGAENVNLLAFADAGFATAELDTSEDAILRTRMFLRPASHADDGSVVDNTTFARYTYTWEGLKFVIYTVFIYPSFYQFICFPPDSDETVQSNSKATDALLLQAGRTLYPPYQDYIAVYDGWWRSDVQLYEEVQKTSWKDVILDQEMKDTIEYTIEEFFDNERRYKDFDVPWKRGIIFHGPPGNGKTLSLRALMHSLIAHASSRPKPITLLYVKSVPHVYSIHAIFDFARQVAPCLVIIEDIDTQITANMLSYFFNEVDGLENNNGILMIATTNHLDKLDEGLKRPSRFDRRYLFPLPELKERTQYCEFWRKKLEKNGAKVEFPKILSARIAGITSGFSFATMKEAFVATLLSLARKGDDKTVVLRDMGHDDIEDLPLWKEMQVQVKLLRKEMEISKAAQNFSRPSTSPKYATQDCQNAADTHIYSRVRDPPPQPASFQLPVASAILPAESLGYPFLPEKYPFLVRSNNLPGSRELRSTHPDVVSQAEAGLLQQPHRSMAVCQRLRSMADGNILVNQPAVSLMAGLLVPGPQLWQRNSRVADLPPP